MAESSGMYRQGGSVRVGLSVTLLFAAGCGGGSPDRGEPYAPSPSGPPASAVIGPEGGTLVSPDGRLSLEFPPGALTEDTTIEIQPLVPIFDPDPSWGWSLAPDGATFSEPVTVRLHFDGDELGGPPDRSEADGLVTETWPALSAGHVSEGGDLLETLSLTGSWDEAEANYELEGVLDHFSDVQIVHLYGGQATLVFPEALQVGETGEIRLGTPPRPMEERPFYLECEGDDVRLRTLTVVGQHLLSNVELIRLQRLEPTGEVRTDEPLPGFISKVQDVNCTEVGTASTILIPTFSAIREGGVPWPTGCTVESRGGVHFPVSFPCTAPVSAVPPGNELMVASIATVSAPGGVLEAGTANGLVRASVVPESEAASCTATAPGTAVCPGLTGTSEAGPPIIHVEVGATDFSAELSYDAENFLYPPQFSELPPFGPGDAISVTTSDSEEEDLFVIQGPWFSDSPPSLLPVLDGLSTSVVIPSDDFDALYVRTDLTGDEVSIAGSVIRIVPAADMELVGGSRRAPVIDDATLAYLDAEGLSVSQVTIGAVEVTVDGDLFGTPVAVMAGQLYEIPVALLEPVSPPDGTTSLVCSADPSDLPQLVPEAHGVLCIESGDTCRLTNDVNEVSPVGAAPCLGDDRALILGDNGTSGFVTAGAGYSIPWASTEVFPERNGTYADIDADEVVYVQRKSDQARWRLAYRIEADNLHILQSTASTGTHPAFGDEFDCRDTPRALSDFVTVGTSFMQGRVCWNSPAETCHIHGDIDATDETEVCPESYAIGFFVLESGDGLVRAGHPTQGAWSVESTTAGTLDGGSWNLTPIPNDVPITTVIANSDTGVRLEIVYQYTTDFQFALTSITRLPAL